MFVILVLYVSYKKKETFQTQGNILLEEGQEITDLANSIPVVSVKESSEQLTTLSPETTLGTTLGTTVNVNSNNINSNSNNINTGGINRPSLQSNNNNQQTVTTSAVTTSAVTTSAVTTSAVTTSRRRIGNPFGIEENPTTTTEASDVTTLQPTIDNLSDTNNQNKFLLDISTVSDFIKTDNNNNKVEKNKKNMLVLTHISIILAILRILYFN